MSKEAMKHYEAALLEAFPRGATGDVFEHWNKARQAIANEALDKKAENARELGLDYEPVQAEKQEPVAYPDGYVVGPCICGSWPGGKCLKCPRITPQPQREWQGLTDDEVTQQVGDSQVLRDVVRAVEHVLKEKNT